MWGCMPVGHGRTETTSLEDQGMKPLIQRWTLWQSQQLAAWAGRTGWLMRAMARRSQELSNETFIWYIIQPGPSIKRIPGVGLSFTVLGMYQEGGKLCWLCSQTQANLQVLFTVSMGHVNLFIYLQMVARCPDFWFSALSGSVWCCGFKMRCPESDSVTGSLNSSWEMKKSLYTYNKNFQPKITYGFNWRRRSCWLFRYGCQKRSS